jgi:hypothetical protein
MKDRGTSKQCLYPCRRHSLEPVRCEGRNTSVCLSMDLTPLKPFRGLQPARLLRTLLIPVFTVRGM